MSQRHPTLVKSPRRHDTHTHTHTSIHTHTCIRTRWHSQLKPHDDDDGDGEVGGAQKGVSLCCCLQRQSKWPNLTAGPRWCSILTDAVYTSQHVLRTLATTAAQVWMLGKAAPWHVGCSLRNEPLASGARCIAWGAGKNNKKRRTTKQHLHVTSSRKPKKHFECAHIHTHTHTHIHAVAQRRN